MSLVDDRAVSSTNAVEGQVGHTMFPLRFTEAVVNSVESWLFADLIEVDNMKVMWTGGRNLLMPTTSTLDCSNKGGEGERENRDCRKGGPTKLSAKGGGQVQQPWKEEPLVGWRKEGASDQRPPSMLEPVLGGVYSPSVVAPPR